MDTIIKEQSKKLIVDKFIDKAVEIAQRANLGFSSTGCLEQQLSVATILYNCSENDVMFNNVQKSNLINILNSI